MAIRKEMAAPDGVAVAYHRIASMHSRAGEFTRLEVESYVSRAEREREMGGDVVYACPEFVELPYDPTLSVIGAYARLKEIEAYEGAVDVLENGQTGTLDDVTRPWAAGIAYLAGDRVMHASAMWVALQAHTSQADWEPGKAPSLFAKVHDSSHGVPEWVQPTGAHDAYAKGDHVTHRGKEWESTVDANVWEPGVYGWEEV